MYKPCHFIIITALILSGCHQSQPKTELNFMFRGDLAEIDTITETIYQFEKEHPKVDVKISLHYQYTPHLIRRIKDEQNVDVAFVEVRDLPVLVEQKLLLPIDDLISQDTSIVLSDYYDHLVNAYRFQNNLYALPRDIAPHGYVFYNQTLLQEAGLSQPDNNWSWPTDFLNLLDAMQQHIDQKQLPVYVFAEDWSCWESLILSNGLNYQDLLQLNNLSQQQSSQFQACIHFYQLLYQRYAYPTTELDKVELFMNGKLAFLYTGYWRTPYFRINCAFDWDIVLFPNGSQTQRAFATGSGGYAIAANSNHPDLAWQLVSYLAGQPGQKELVRSGVAQPADRTLLKDTSLFANEPPHNLAALTFAAQHVQFQPATQQWRQLLYHFYNPFFTSLMQNPDQAPKQVLNHLKKRFTLFLNQASERSTP